MEKRPIPKELAAAYRRLAFWARRVREIQSRTNRNHKNAEVRKGAAHVG